MAASRLVLLVQLPIPPPGPGPAEENVPLAAAYLKLFARRQGLEEFYAIELLPPALVSSLGDQGLIDAILSRQPWMVAFTCYVWNVERTLWIAGRLRDSRPDLKIVIGGPEITADNAWVLDRPAVDFAVLGEGEIAFAELLKTAATNDRRIPALLPAVLLPELDRVSSPYVEGILDVSDGRRMLLETVRGCRFQCKYCYYPKGDRSLRLLSSDQILANLRHAAEQGATEVVLLDPTLNQRPDFADFLDLLCRGNADRRLNFFGELRAEGIDAGAARLLRQANFHEVEIGLQSVEPAAWELMGRPTNLVGFERGVRALLDEGIKVQVDLILGLPGDTADSVRRGIDFLHDRGLYSQVQVFNLSILPGTAFRREAEALGIRYQPWPPYYVTKTPTLEVTDLCQLMEEAQEAFGIEFDPLPPPRLDAFDDRNWPRQGCRIDLDLEGDYGDGGGTAEKRNMIESRPAVPPPSPVYPPFATPALGFTLWLRAADFHQRRRQAAQLVGRLLADNPHTTLQVVLEPTADPERLTIDTLELLLATCYQNPTYLDRYYSLHPGPLLGSKRLVVAIGRRARVSEQWRHQVGQYATIVMADDE
jgi:hypothetical protein